MEIPRKCLENLAVKSRPLWLRNHTWCFSSFKMYPKIATWVYLVSVDERVAANSFTVISFKSFGSGSFLLKAMVDSVGS